MKMVIKKDRCHKCGVEIEDGMYYCSACQLEFEISGNLNDRL